MTRAVRIFCSLSQIWVNVCTMSALFTVISAVEDMVGRNAGLLFWICCLSLCHVAVSLLLESERSERMLIIVYLVFFCVQTLLIFVFHGIFSGFIGMLTAIAMWLGSYFISYELNVRGVTADKLSRSFDLSILVLLFAVLFCSVRELDFSVCLPLGIAAVICLLALVLIRGSHERKLQSLFMSGGIILCAAGVSGLFVALASGGIRKLLAWFSETAMNLIKYIFGLIDAFFLFLISLLPEQEYEAVLPEPESADQLAGMGEQSFETLDPRIVMGIFFAFAFLIAAAFVIYRFSKGRGRQHRMQGGSMLGVKRRRAGLAGNILRALSRLVSRFSFMINSIVKRNTVPGLFTETERRSRRKTGGRGRSESCREFLIRVTEHYPHAAVELMNLADAMDSIMFGGGEGLSRQEIKKLRHKIFAADKEKIEV